LALDIFINIPIGFLSFFLSSRLLKDPLRVKRREPPYEQTASYIYRWHRDRADSFGVGGTGSALDRVNRRLVREFVYLLDARDRSHRLDRHCSVGNAAEGTRHRLPVASESQLRDRECPLLRVRIRLFGSTTLIPQILQSLYGYRATDAGLVLGRARL